MSNRQRAIDLSGVTSTSRIDLSKIGTVSEKQAARAAMKAEQTNHVSKRFEKVKSHAERDFMFLIRIKSSFLNPNLEMFLICTVSFVRGLRILVFFIQH